MAQVTGAQLFEQLAQDLAGGKAAADVTAWLESQGVNATVAEMVGGAIQNPGTVALPAGTTVTLGDAVGPFLPSGVTLPTTWAAVQITALSFSADAATKAFTFNGSLSAPLAFANQRTTLDLTLVLGSAQGTSGPSVTGSLGGSLSLGDQELDAVLDLQTATPGSAAELRCSWKAGEGETIGLEALCTSFGLDAPTLVQGLPDLGLTRVDMVLDVDSADGQKVLLDADYSGGEAFVLVDHVTSGESPGWVLVLGGELEGELSSWPVVGTELAALDPTLTLAGGGLLLVSTADYDGLHPPAFDGGDDPFGGFPVDVTDRFMAVGILDLSAASDGTAAGHLGTIDGQDGRPSGLPAGHLLVSVTLPHPTLTATLGERNLFGRFPMVDLSLAVAVQPIHFTLSGSVTLHLKSDLTFTVGLTLTDEAVTGSLDIEDSTPVVLTLPDVPDVPSLELSELGGLVGVDFAKQEFVLGLMATFGFGGAPPSGTKPDTSGFAAMLPAADGSGGGAPPARPAPDQCALVLGINDDTGVVPVPDLDLLMLSVPDANLIAILGTVLPGVSTSQVEDVLGDVKVKNLLLYWCDDPAGLVLPDGTACQAGFRFHGALDFWGLAAWAELDVTSAGFTGDAVLSPLSLGALSDGTAALTVTGNGAVDPDTDAADAGVTPGGPFLHVSTSDSTCLSAAWDVTLFGEASTSVAVTVAEDSFVFDVEASVPEIQGALTCTVTHGGKYLTASFQLSVGTIAMPAVLGVQLPPVTLDGAVSLTLTLDVRSGFDLSVDGSLTFEGETLDIPALPLDAAFTDLKDLPGLVVHHIESEAETIFKDDLGQAEALLVEYGDKSAKEIEKLAEDAYGEVKAIVKWVLGYHQDHKPDWLEDGAIVCGGIEYDMIHHSKRRQIPDVTTLDQLGGPGVATTLGAILESVPKDDVQIPTRTNGSVVTREDGTQFLILDDTDSSGATVGARYQLKDAAAFTTATAGLPNRPTWQQGLPAAEGDIDDIPKHGQLSSPCLIHGSDATDVSVFVDGIRYPVSTSTQDVLAPDLTKDVRTLLDSAYGAIAQGGAFPTLGPDVAVMGPTDPTVYQVQDDGKLKAFKDMLSLAAYGYTASDIQTLPVPVDGLFRIGDKLPEKPKH